MKIQAHIIYSCGLSGILFFIIQSWLISVSTFISGILIDIDHLVDYFINEKQIKFDIKDFFYKCENNKLLTAVLPFHSYEFILLLILISYFVKDSILTGISIGFSIHLLIDVIAGVVKKVIKIQNYSILYRGFVLKFQYSKTFYFSQND